MVAREVFDWWWATVMWIGMFSNHMKTNIMCMATSEYLYIDMWSWFGRRWQWKFSIVMGHCELDWNVFKPWIMKGQTTMNKLYMRWVWGGLSRFPIKLKNHIQKFFGQCYNGEHCNNSSRNKSHTEEGLGAPHFLMLQVVLKAKLTLSHLGQIQSPSCTPSGPAYTTRRSFLR